MKFLTVLLLVLLFAPFTLQISIDNSPTEAYILASKSILNEHIAEQKDVTLLYLIYNIGKKTAYDVTLIDTDICQPPMSIIIGNNTVLWSELGPESNLTHSIIIRSSKISNKVANCSSAVIEFKKSRDSTEIVKTKTSEPGVIALLSHSEYSRKFDAHIIDWLAFAFMIIPTIGIPFFNFYRSYAKYQNIAKMKLN